MGRIRFPGAAHRRGEARRNDLDAQTGDPQLSFGFKRTTPRDRTMLRAENPPTSGQGEFLGVVSPRAHLRFFAEPSGIRPFEGLRPLDCPWHGGGVLQLDPSYVTASSIKYRLPV